MIGTWNIMIINYFVTLEDYDTTGLSSEVIDNGKQSSRINMQTVVYLFVSISVDLLMDIAHGLGYLKTITCVDSVVSSHHMYLITWISIKPGICRSIQFENIVLILQCTCCTVQFIFINKISAQVQS